MSQRDLYLKLLQLIKQEEYVIKQVRKSEDEVQIVDDTQN